MADFRHCDGVFCWYNKDFSDKVDCSFCTTIKEQALGNTILSDNLLSKNGAREHYNLDKVARDLSSPVYDFAKE